MKAFVALLCLVAVVVAQNANTTTTKAPTTTTKAPTTTTKAPATTTKAPTTTEDPVTEPPVDCDISVGEEDWAVLLPNPNSCESYYVCDAGEPILMQCPEGLHFNPELCVCDWPEDANCTVGWTTQKDLATPLFN